MYIEYSIRLRTTRSFFFSSIFFVIYEFVVLFNFKLVYLIILCGVEYVHTCSHVNRPLSTDYIKMYKAQPVEEQQKRTEGHKNYVQNQQRYRNNNNVTETISWIHV